MALPKISHPVYKITVPSTKKSISIRPFTVKEEKILLLAKASDDPTDAIDAIRQIITNCIIDDININKLAIFDIEYLFIQLRAKSVSDKVDLIYPDPEGDIKFTVDLNEVQIKFNPEHKNKFNVHKDVGLIMRYPSLDEINELERAAKESSDEAVFDVFIKCVEKVYDDNKVYDEFTFDEMKEFIMSLPIEGIASIKKFFDTMPSLEHEVELKNKMGEVRKVALKGISSFFPS